MANQAYLKRKKEVGERVFTNFKQEIRKISFTKGLHAEKIIQASEIVEEMPFVTMPLYENGILRTGERNTHLLHTYQPNLWAQDYAHEVGELGKMVVGTAIERANASVSHLLEVSPAVRATLKRTGTTEYDFFVAMRQAALIESAYYTRLGKGEMPEKARKKIDAALLKRTYKNMPLFKVIIDSLGINGLDGKELLDFSDDINLTETLQIFVEKDPYYNRRINLIQQFGEINSERSASLKTVKAEDFYEEMMYQAVKRFPSMRRRLERVFQRVSSF